MNKLIKTLGITINKFSIESVNTKNGDRIMNFSIAGDLCNGRFKESDNPSIRFMASTDIPKYLRGFRLGRKLYGRQALQAYKHNYNELSVFITPITNRNILSFEAERLWKSLIKPHTSEIYNKDNLGFGKVNSDNKKIIDYICKKINTLNIEYNKRFTTNIHANGSTKEIKDYMNTYNNPTRYTIDIVRLFNHVNVA